MSGPECVKASTREDMLEAVVRTGMSRADAAVLTDISKHACDEAVSAIMRVTDTAPPNLKVAILSSALATLCGVLRDTFPKHWAALLESMNQPVQDEAATVITLPDESEARP